MAQSLELQLTCPNCGTEFETKGHTIVDAGDEADAEVLWELQNGTLNVAHCPKCEAGGFIPIPVVYHDPQRELLLAFVPNANEMDEESLGGMIGPILQAFISSVPEDQQQDYLFRPIVTDDPVALQAAANGDLLGEEGFEEGSSFDYGDEDEGDEEGEEEELSPEDQQEIQQRIQLLQRLMEAEDSLQRITLLRSYKTIVDDLFQQMLGVLMQQAQNSQPMLVEQLQKIMNEIEVFRASSAS
jgi:hypothetical protein